MPTVYTFTVIETRKIRVTAENPSEAVTKSQQPDELSGRPRHWETTDVRAYK